MAEWQIPRGEGGGVLWISRFQVTGMIEWGQKSNPQKNPWTKINPKEIPCQISEP